MAARKKRRTRSARPGGRTAKGRFRKGYHMTPSGRYVKGTKKKGKAKRTRRRRRSW